MKSFILGVFFVFNFLVAQSQNRKVDSLEKILKSATGSEEGDILAQLSEEYLYQDLEVAFGYASKALQKARSTNSNLQEMQALNAMGNCYLQRANAGDIEKAFEQYTKSLELKHTPNVKEQLQKAKSLSGLVNIYYGWGDYQEALEFNQHSLDIRKEYNDAVGLARCYNASGVISDALKDYKNAVKYYSESLKIYQELNLKREVAGTLDNLASAIKLQSQTTGKTMDYSQVIEYYNQSLEISKQLGDTKGISRTLNNLGIVAENQDDSDKALSLYLEAQKINMGQNDLNSLANTYNNIAGIYKKKEDFGKAIEFYEKALEASNQTKGKYEMQVSFKALADIYEKLNNPQEAYNYLKLSNFYKSELENTDNIRKASQLRSKHDIEKKQRELERSQQKAEQDRQERKFLLGLAAFLLCMAFIVVAFLYRQNQIKADTNKKLQQLNKTLEAQNIDVKKKSLEINQQKELISAQKKDIEEKNQVLQITLSELGEKNQSLSDSITYARRIQESVMPKPEYLVSQLQEGFVMYQPRNVVGGDFYWVENFGDELMLVLSDCTGHGVPGALMTMLGTSLLNEVVNSMGIKEPKEVLKTINTRMTTEHQGYKQIPDGMDMGIILINKKSKTITFSGAKTSLWYFKNGELNIIKGNRFPLGGLHYQVEKVFEQTTFEYQISDTFYLFSDGIIDQFGTTNKKLMSKGLKTILQSLNHLPMHTQYTKLEHELTTWKGQNSQTDDMLMIGIRL